MTDFTDSQQTVGPGAGRATRAMLVQHLAMTYDTIEANVNDMTAEQSLARPAPGGNCANWILGHLVNVHNGLMELIGERAVWDSEELKRAGFEPIEDRNSAIDWNTLRDRFIGSRKRCLSALGRLTDEQLADELPHPFSGTCSRAELLTILAFHQAYHSGQLGIARRVAGLPGKIKGPGQQA